MGKTLEDAGLLVKGADGSLKVSDPTTQKFLKLRNQKIDERKLSVVKINFEDKEKYPDFFKKWIDGILLNMLINLNLNGNISIPIYDPTAMGAKLELGPSPNLTYSQLLLALASPPGSPIPLLLLGIPAQDLPDIFGKIPGVISAPIPPIPQLPVPISTSFPSLGEDFFRPVNFSLLGKHIGINLSIPKAFSGLLGSISSPDFLAKFSIDGLIGLAKKSVQASFPSTPAPNLTDYELNMEVISEIMSEAIGITTIGVVIGSSNSGIVGQIGAAKEHREPPPPPQKVISNDKIPYVRGIERTDVEFRRSLFNLSVKTGINVGKLAAVISAESAQSFAANIRAGENPNIKSGKRSVGFYQQNHKTKDNKGPAVGLIQFTAAAVNLMNENFGPSGRYSTLVKPGLFPTTMTDLGNLTADKQLEYVYAYLLAVANFNGNSLKKFNNGNTLYYKVFAPSFQGGDIVYRGDLAKANKGVATQLPNGEWVVYKKNFDSYATRALSTTTKLFIKVDELKFVNQNDEEVILKYEKDQYGLERVVIPT